MEGYHSNYSYIAAEGVVAMLVLIEVAFSMGGVVTQEEGLTLEAIMLGDLGGEW